jgi:hypothetical protein
MDSEVFKTGLSRLISSLKDGRLCESAEAFISEITRIDEMLKLLQGLEKVRIDPCYAQREVLECYDNVTFYIARLKGELLLTTVIKCNRQYLLNLFSLENSYCRILDTSYDRKSALNYLQQVITTTFGFKMGRSLKFLIPLLGASPWPVLNTINESLDSLVLQVYIACPKELNNVIPKIVEFLSVPDLSRYVLNAFFDIFWDAKIYRNFCELEVNEKNRSMVASLMVYHSHFLSSDKFRNLETNDQLNLLIEAMKMLEQKEKYKVFLWRIDSKEYLDLNVNAHSYQICAAIYSLIDFFADNDIHVSHVNDILLDLLARYLSDKDTKKVLEYYLLRIGKKDPTVNRLSILSWFKFCLEGPQVSVFLNTKLFLSDIIDSSPELYELVKEFLVFMTAWTEESPRKLVFDYCLTRPLILFDVYTEIARMFPLDARLAEDAVAECLLRIKDDTKFDAACHFNYKNRAKFFSKVQDSVSTVYDLPFSNDCRHPNRCIQKNLTLGITEKDRILSLMSLAPETYPEILTEENRFRAKHTTSDYRIFCRYIDRLLRMIQISDSGNLYGTAAEAYHVVSVVMRNIKSNPKLYPTLFFYVGQIMIRYRIKDQKLFASLKISHDLVKEIYQELVISDPSKKSVDLTRIESLVHPKKIEYIRSLICVREYLTDQTMQGFERFPAVILAAVSKNIKSKHEEFAECILDLYWFEEIENYIDGILSPDLPDTSKLRIFSHLFFIDEAEHLTEIHGTEFLVQICVGTAIHYEFRE